MSKLSLIIVALCITQFAVARHVREAPATASDGWNNFLSSANETFKALHQAVLNVADVKTDDELVTKVQDRVKSFGTEVQGHVNTLTEETKSQSGKVEELYKTFTDKVTEVANDLKARNPDILDSKKLQANVESRLRVVADETEKLRTRLTAEGGPISDKVEDLLKTILENTLSAATNVRQQVESAVTDKKQ